MKFWFLVLSMTASAATLVDSVRESIARNDLPRAVETIRSYRASRGVTPEAVEALSWMARAELARRGLGDTDPLSRL